jgi:GT2 family glycosyltransferase
MQSIEPSSHEHAQMSSAVSLVAAGIVVFNNSHSQLENLGRSLRRAGDRLTQDNARPATGLGSIFLFNNGDLPVDPTAFGPHARLKSAETNLGFGRAHNLLMGEAFAEGAEFYLALNPDGMLHPDAIFEMIALARRCEGRALVEAAQFPEELPKAFDPLTLDTPWASGCCLIVPAGVHAAIGGFDENLFLFCEDVDLSWRARDAGFLVKHAPRALFHHRFNRIGNEVSRRAHLDAARYLAARWGGEALSHQVEREMAGRGWEPRPLPASTPSPSTSSVADFHHGLNFAPLRWNCPGPIPIHTVSRHADLDNTIDVIVRFHDPAQIGRLSRCLLSLYGQDHQPIQVLLMLQGLDDAGVAAVEACVDSFDWATPRRRPLVTNVAVPPTGDHRSRLWNAGLDAGRARYLGICDFDDTSYAAGYGYLLHRLQVSGAAAAFASSLVVDCTPMNGFDYAFAKRFLEGEDRYDFFVAGFCPPNCVLFDRARIAPSDLRADETLSKQEDYRVFVAIAAKYETDWKSIGTAVGEYYNRTDGSNTVLSHRRDVAGLREWDEVLEAGRKYLGTLTTEVPVTDIMRMRGAERRLRQELAERETQLALALGSRSMRMTRPFRAAAKWARRVLR